MAKTSWAGKRYQTKNMTQKNYRTFLKSGTFPRPKGDISYVCRMRDRKHLEMFWRKMFWGKCPYPFQHPAFWLQYIFIYVHLVIIFGAKLKSIYWTGQGDMERAEQLRVDGQALIGCGQYAVDCVQPKCAELERICTEFTAHFNYRLSRLNNARLMWTTILQVRMAPPSGLTAHSAT